MWAASTPLNRKRKHPSDEVDWVISPIKKRATKPARGSRPGPASQPLNDVSGIANIPHLLAAPRRVSNFSTLRKLKEEGVCPSLPDPLLHDTLPPRGASATRAGLHSHLPFAPRSSTRNQSVFPELIVVSDSDDEYQCAETVHRKSQKSVGSQKSMIPRNTTASKRTSKRIGVGNQQPANQDDPFFKDFTRVSTKNIRSSNVPKSEKSIKLSTISENRRQSVFVEKSEYYAFEATRVKQEIHYCAEQNEVENVAACPRITKFTLGDVESWKEVKDQPGCYFTRGLPALSSGVDGEPFPSRCGYLKMGPKTKLDIPSSPNALVFTVIKGKGYLKEKTVGTAGQMEKVEMMVGETFIVPKGSAFLFTNLATKNDFIMGYVKHNM